MSVLTPVSFQAAIQPLVRTAWAESPSLAVHLASRFPYPRVQNEVRWLLLNFPAKAVEEPEAIPILIDGALPEDVSFQLKVTNRILTMTQALLTMRVSTCCFGRQSTQSLPSRYSCRPTATTLI